MIQLALVRGPAHTSIFFQTRRSTVSTIFRPLKQSIKGKINESK